jgi:hypothetical protein
MRFFRSAASISRSGRKRRVRALEVDASGLVTRYPEFPAPESG